VQSGRAIGQALDEAAQQIRQQLNGHGETVREVDRQIHELLDRRSSTLRDLAAHYLPDMSPETVARTFVEIRDDLLEVLARKQRRQREIEDQIATEQQVLQRTDAELAGITEQLNDKVAQREDLEARLAERLQSSDEFKHLSKQALEAEMELEHNEARVAEIESEAREKLPSFDNSRLFRYLHDTGYGTADYAGTGMTARIDRWVAKLIDYQRARRSYDFLRITPTLMRQEVERRRTLFNGLMEQVEEIEDRVSDEIGLTEVMREGQQLGSQRDALVARLAECQNGLLASQEQLIDLERPQNEFYQQALARMQNFLANARHAQLERQSRETPEREDDTIVAELSWLNDQLADADQRQDLLNRQRKGWDQRLGSLQELAQRFRAAEFDSRRSEFQRDFDIQRLLSELLDGRIGVDKAWSVMREYQQFVPTLQDQHRDVDLSDVLDSDFSHVLFGVLADVAGHALRNAAYRGMQRRGPARQEQRRTQQRPTFRKRGFTNGRGF
jgi:chromosome segregation ATPase